MPMLIHIYPGVLSSGDQPFVSLSLSLSFCPRAMAVLQECSMLKIEDILPFFPDFVTIDDFQVRPCSLRGANLLPWGFRTV